MQFSWLGVGSKLRFGSINGCQIHATSLRADSTVSQVCDLFCTNKKSWDPSKLVAIFYPWEAKMVSQVQVSEACDEDLLVWPFMTDKGYSVRSACLLASEEWDTNSSSSMMIEQKCLWKWSPNIRFIISCGAQLRTLFR